MRGAPQHGRHAQGIDALTGPPGSFVASPVKLAVMEATQGNGESVADLAVQRGALRKLDVVRIGWRPAADQAGLRGHESEMMTSALPHELIDHDHDRIVDHACAS